MTPIKMLVGPVMERLRGCRESQEELRDTVHALAILLSKLETQLDRSNELARQSLWLGRGALLAHYRVAAGHTLVRVLAVFAGREIGWQQRIDWSPPHDLEGPIRVEALHGYAISQIQLGSTLLLDGALEHAVSNITLAVDGYDLTIDVVRIA